MTKKSPSPVAHSVCDVTFDDALAERYLAYALATITSRALPDARDGLKPVHRRLLYAMYQLKLNPKGGFKKSARVVGDVMGKFHPHGDMAIYDALVRLAQDFSVRYPLIEGQGNFGNIDGDNAAAMRYTEARLTDTATFLFEGIEDEAIPFGVTYDNEGTEPEILPAAIPHLLANGASGIAVGMATNIPPHNLYELLQALRALIENPKIKDDDLLDYIKGPDFPTGGAVTESREHLAHIYACGKGSVRLRADYIIEERKGGTYDIIITGIPYQVQKAKLLEKIADLMHQKKLPLLGGMMDESSEDVRIILSPKSRNVDPEHLMASLFQQTDLEVRFSFNMNVMTAKGRPEVLSLKNMLQAFLDHRFSVLQNRTRYRLTNIENRLHLLDGLLVVYLNLDAVIDIIRTHDHPKQELMTRFDLSEIQAEAVLNIRLRALRKLHEMEIKKEHSELLKEQKSLQSLLDSPLKQNKYLSKEFEKLGQVFGEHTEIGKRRTRITGPASVIDLDEVLPVDVEDTTFVLSEKGWVRSIKGHVCEEDIKYKEGDNPLFVLTTQNTAKILIFTELGKVFTLSQDKLSGGKGMSAKQQGDPLRLLVDMSADDEIVFCGLFDQSASYIVVASNGKGFAVKGENLLAQTRQGKQIMNCGKDARTVFFAPLTHEHIAMIGTHRKILIIPTSDIPFLNRGQGVVLQKYKDATLSDVMFLDVTQGLKYRRGLKNAVEKDLTPWCGKRGSTGRLAPLGFPRTNTFKG